MGLCEDACEDLFDGPSEIIVPGILENTEDVQEMWEIDLEAYKDCSISFESFLAWWKAYPFGSRVLRMQDGPIVASIGIYPLYQAQAEEFSSGAIKEAALKPVAIRKCERSPVSNWYVSGIVIKPDYRKRGLLRRLLRICIDAWANSGHVAPGDTNVIGLAEYQIGRKLLEKYGFSLLKNGSELPDGCDLYQRIFNLDQSEWKEKMLSHCQ